MYSLFLVTVCHLVCGVCSGVSQSVTQCHCDCECIVYLFRFSLPCVDLSPLRNHPSSKSFCCRGWCHWWWGVNWRHGRIQGLQPRTEAGHEHAQVWKYWWHKMAWARRCPVESWKLADNYMLFASSIQQRICTEELFSPENNNKVGKWKRYNRKVIHRSKLWKPETAVGKLGLLSFESVPQNMQHLCSFHAQVSLIKLFNKKTDEFSSVSGYFN